MSRSITTLLEGALGAAVALALLLAAPPGPANRSRSPIVSSIRIWTSGVSRGFAPAWHSPCARPPFSPLSYDYPIRPFDRQHPVRGSFGDPRTDPLSSLEPNGPGASGSFDFHNGIDIVARTGSVVYPVVSGIARLGYGDEVIVHTWDDRIFQYFHIHPLVRPGQRVLAYLTPLGRVEPGYLHVHMSEIDGTRVHNPLDPGHLEPYRDHTLPVVRGVEYTGDLGQPLDPSALVGMVNIAAEADDPAALPIASGRPGFAVTPALVAWSLTGPSKDLVVPRRTAVDFRRTEPPNRDFWRVYAPGTRQNEYADTREGLIGSSGRYLFRLTQNPLDTRRLADGRYVLRVDVADTCGNRSWLKQTLRLVNRERG